MDKAKLAWDNLRFHIESIQSDLDKRAQAIKGKEMELVDLEKTIRDRKSDLKWRTQELHQEENKHGYLVKKRQEEQKKIKACSEDLSTKVYELRNVNASLAKRRDELKMAESEVNLLGKRKAKSEARVEELERIIKEKETEVKKYGESSRKNRDSHGDEISKRHEDSSNKNRGKSLKRHEDYSSKTRDGIDGDKRQCRRN